MLDGLSVFTGLLLLFMWLGPSLRRKVAGLGGFTDVGIHIVLQVMLGGAAEGRMAMLFGGVMFNIALLVYRKLRGYHTIVNGEWVPHSGWFWRI